MVATCTLGVVYMCLPTVCECVCISTYHDANNYVGYPSNEKLIVLCTHHHDPKWPVHQAIPYHWMLDGLPYRINYTVVL